jgi:hypothetical protein
MNFILDDGWDAWKVKSECVCRAKVAELMMILLIALIWYFIEEAVGMVPTMGAWTSSYSSLPQAESSPRTRTRTHKTLG